MKPDDVFLLVVLWVVFGTGVAGVTTGYVESKRVATTTRQSAVLFVAIWLLAPVALTAWILVGLFVALRALGGGVAEWRRDLFPTKIAPVPPGDAFQELAEREVETLLEGGVRGPAQP